MCWWLVGRVCRWLVVGWWLVRWCVGALVVEGSVEAALMDSRALEVASGGYFTGTAVVDSAQIAGHFEGDLTVEGLLTLASTGRIIGTIRFGELEVERGGTMTGTLSWSSSSPLVSLPPSS